MHTPRSIKAVLAATAIAVLTTGPVSAADDCATAADVEAFAMRDLQSRLMVAGLACGQRDAYNVFIETHQTSITRTGARLKSYFLSRGEGVAAIDRHVTRVANAAARTHGLERDAFCTQTASLFKELQDIDQRGLVRIARQSGFRSVTKPSVCTADAPSEKAKVAVGE